MLRIRSALLDFSKDDLVVAYLEQKSVREREHVAFQRNRFSGNPCGFLRWYADRLGEASCGPGFRGCAFINARAELADSDHPGQRIIAEYRSWQTSQAAELLIELKVADPLPKAEQLVMLRDGAMVAGYLGRTPAAITASLVAAGLAVIGA